MKKTTILLMMLLVSSLSFAQNAPITFEPGEPGADWTWTVFENATNPPLEIIANPDQSGANTSATVAKFTALQGGQPWAGVESMQGNLGEFFWDANNRIVKIMVWKSVISDVGIKFDAGANPNDWSAGEIKVANTLINQWEELTFDFSNSPNPPAEFGGLKRIAIFPDFTARTQDNIVYFDNISFHPSGTPANEPTVAAPAPTFDAANVISLHSQPYTDVPVDTWHTGWSQAAYEEVMINGRPTKKYSNLDFVGIETVANQIDITGMTHFHIHVWSPDFTLFRVKLVDFGPGGNTEHEVPFTGLAQGEWVSLSIPLTDFVNLQGRENIAQLILSGQPVGATTVYVDNVLFYNDSGPVSGINAPIDFEEGGFGADWTWTVFENATNPALEIIANPDQSGANTSATVAKFTALQGGQPWAGVESLEGNLGAFTWDETNSTVKIMVWKSIISDVGIKFDGGAAPNNWSSGEIKVANTLINQWEELTFDFSGAPNPPAEVGGLKRIAIFPDFTARTQDNIVYFDNISFHPSGTPANEPTVAAPAPTFDAANVISLHSQPYTDVPVDTWRTDWSQAAYEEVMINGRPTKKYSNLDFVGIETVANQIDITGMTHFHMHVWSPDFTVFKVKLVDIGPDGAFGGGDDTEHELEFSALPQGEWVSLNIPLADFTSLQNRQNIAQLILAGQPTGATTVFVDNVLFYNDSGQAGGPNAPIDFEEGGFGADWTWTVFENDTNPPLEIIANPDQSGANTSATVAKFTALEAGNPWAGVESLQGDLGEFYWDETNSIVKIMVWKSVISDVGIKFDTGEAPNDWSAGEIKVANTVTGEWEELTFNFSGSENPPAEFGGLKRIIIFPDYDLDGREQDNVVYFDNITFSAASGDDPPPVPSGLVVSNMIGDNPVGDGELFLAAGPNQVGGAVVYKLFYSKTADAPANPTTATEYTFGTTAGDGDGIGAFGFVLGGLDPGVSYTAWLYQYNTVEDLLSPGAATGSAISGGGSTTPDAPTVAAPTPTIDEANVISLFSDAYTDVTVDTWRTGWSQANYEEVNIDGNPTKKYTNLDFVGVETVANQIDITGMTHFHLHVWSPNFTLFRVKLVDFGANGAFGGGDDTEHEVPFPALNQGEWVSLDIPLTDFANLAGRQNIAQLIFSGQPVGATTVYIDNVFFYTTGTNVNDLDAAQNQVRVYPNPVRSGESVTFSTEVKQVDVFDLSGRMIMSSNASVINTAGMNRGVYFVRIHTLDGGLQTQKLVVN